MMTAATKICGICDGIVDLDDDLEEYSYDITGAPVHTACMEEKAMAEDPNRRGIVTQVKQGQTNGRDWAFFYLNGKHDRDTDPSYSLDMRQAGAPVPNEGDSIYFTYKINGAYNNVIMFERVEATEGEVETVKATVTATQDKREEGIFRSVALQQAVAYCTPLGHSVAVVEDTYLHFLRMLTNPASLREPGDVENHTYEALKPVLDQNGTRNEVAYLLMASEDVLDSQDVQGAHAYPTSGERFDEH